MLFSVCVKENKCHINHCNLWYTCHMFYQSLLWCILNVINAYFLYFGACGSKNYHFCQYLAWNVINAFYYLFSSVLLLNSCCRLYNSFVLVLVSHFLVYLLILLTVPSYHLFAPAFVHWWLQLSVLLAILCHVHSSSAVSVYSINKKA